MYPITQKLIRHLRRYPDASGRILAVSYNQVYAVTPDYLRYEMTHTITAGAAYDVSNK
jgi:hypothetical protein